MATPAASLVPVLIAGRWRDATACAHFRAENPATREPLAEQYPVSAWADVDAALDAACVAAAALAGLPDAARAAFLEDYAARIEARADALVATAHRETGLPESPRLREVELPRTTGQLRQAAAAAREGSWRLATIDTKANIRCCYAPIGPVAVFGPNNFPFAFGSASGGDFAAAIAAGNPVLAKAHPLHPATTRLFAEEAQRAADATGLPPGSVQLLYHLPPEDGFRLVSDPRLGATAFTGSRSAGLALKAAADAAGLPIYLELSSLNPVVVLPGALAERGAAIAEELTTSGLMAAGQFCTNPGLVFLLAGAEAEAFVAELEQRYAAAPCGTLLSAGVAEGLADAVAALRAAGAELVTGDAQAPGGGYARANTLLRVTGAAFLARGSALAREAFGNATLVVLAEGEGELAQALARLEGQLTGALYSARGGADDAAYARLEPLLRRRVGRLLNDKMPTGVAVSPAMVHGGPFPATGHPGFTSVGIPAALRRFAVLHGYDAVREPRLPPVLRDSNPGGTWRLVDGEWSRGDVAAG